MEKRFSQHPERFGQGAIEGVAGPETANNAGTGGAFIPLLTLGIPSNAVMAMLSGRDADLRDAAGTHAHQGSTPTFSGARSPACTSEMPCSSS